jgi:hypothetical protein
MKVDLKSFPTVYGSSKTDKYRERTGQLKLTEAVLKLYSREQFRSTETVLRSTETFTELAVKLAVGAGF